MENEAVEQLAFADRVIVNKTDLVTSEELEQLTEEVRKINSFAPMIYTQRPGSYGFLWLLPLGTRR